VTVSNPPNTHHLTTSSEQRQFKSTLEEKSIDMPDSSPTASGIKSSTVGDEIDVKEDTQGHKYND